MAPHRLVDIHVYHRLYDYYPPVSHARCIPIRIAISPSPPPPIPILFALMDCTAHTIFADEIPQVIIFDKAIIYVGTVADKGFDLDVIII